MWIKICGVTTVEDAMRAAEAGADAIGLNFYRRSPRRVDAKTAADIVAALPSGVVAVGVFVNAERTELEETMRAARLDRVQLHGDEPLSWIAALDWPVIRAVRLAKGADLTALARELGAAAPAMVLIDAHAPGAYGGTGETADWEQARELSQRLAPIPCLLAGGLRPDNVSAAIAAVRPSGVDAASGVESSPGRKDPDLVRQFVQAIRSAS